MHRLRGLTAKRSYEPANTAPCTLLKHRSSIYMNASQRLHLPSLIYELETNTSTSGVRWTENHCSMLKLLAEQRETSHKLLFIGKRRQQEWFLLQSIVPVNTKCTWNQVPSRCQSCQGCLDRIAESIWSQTLSALGIFSFHEISSSRIWRSNVKAKSEKEIVKVKIMWS